MVASGSEEQSNAHAPELRVLLIAENASYRFGGEAVLPLHYFRLMRKRGIPVWMILNERNRAELQSKLAPEDLSHLLFIPDDWIHRTLARMKNWMPASVASFTLGQVLELIDQRRAVRLARRLQHTYRFTIAHQPTPVSPKHVSILWNRGRRGLGIPVVMGPMNGGITYPRGFRKREHPLDRAFISAGRTLASLVHRVLPGKLRAETLMCANPRTVQALPKGVRGRVVQVVENGVDLSLYQHGHQHPRERKPGQPVRFVFAGRLVDFKAVDLLIRAFGKAATQAPMELHILGDGPLRRPLEKLASELGALGRQVLFHGWMSHKECAAHMADADVFVLPSLRECGGAVVLEAMAMRLPIITANWGGPADYVDASCGILVDPHTPDQFIGDLARAMVELAKSPARRADMGAAGYEKVLREYDWDRKLEQVLGIYHEAIQRASGKMNAKPAPQPPKPPLPEEVETPAEPAPV
ncbi:MAG: glycosyltransferase family 4 protein [Phycisphaerae bacterium]